MYSASEHVSLTRVGIRSVFSLSSWFWALINEVAPLHDQCPLKQRKHSENICEIPVSSCIVTRPVLLKEQWSTDEKFMMKTLDVVHLYPARHRVTKTLGLGDGKVFILFTRTPRVTNRCFDFPPKVTEFESGEYHPWCTVQAAAKQECTPWRRYQMPFLRWRSHLLAAKLRPYSTQWGEVGSWKVWKTVKVIT